MKDDILLHGLVLSAAPVRDYDKRLTLLTMEEGRTTVWAAGAKKQGSAYMAACRSFVFGTFQLGHGRSGYNLHSVKVLSYFEDIALDLSNACYGSYLLELADFVTQEKLPARETVNLLYLSLKAVLNPSIPDELVRRIFELRLLLENGEYTENPPLEASEACCYAWRYILTAALPKLYTFTLAEPVLQELGANVDLLLRDTVPVPLRSLRMLESMRK